MKKEERFKKVWPILEKQYPGADCALIHKNAFELLIATILSAQCTDKRVNMVTPALFKRFPTPKALGDGPIEEIEELIRTTGFYRNKAKNIKATGKKLAQEFGGKIPKTMEEMLTLHGVARKTANVVLGTAFGITSGIVVDTHVSRLAFRMGLTTVRENAVKIERELCKIVPKKHWILFSHVLILHGRAICDARKPKCETCSVVRHCVFGSKKVKE